MKRFENIPVAINSVAEYHQFMELPKPEHPLISVVNFEDILSVAADRAKSVVFNFYTIWLKRNFKGKMKYGQQLYDFDEGMMSFFSPGQVITRSEDGGYTHSGYGLIIHPDFLWNYTLAKKIKEYGYFSYAVNEALFLSEREEATITDIILNIQQEYRSVIDRFSQNVIVSYLEVLLNYADRFYNRQFATRRMANHDFVNRFEALLVDYIHSGKMLEEGLPTVQYFASQLHVSPNYMTDLLRNITGQSTQQHIQDKLIDKAKELLTTTTLSISEIAYELGFGYSQSFNRVFKNKTTLSPNEFRRSFN